MRHGRTSRLLDALDLAAWISVVAGVALLGWMIALPSKYNRTGDMPAEAIVFLADLPLMIVGSLWLGFRRRTRLVEALRRLEDRHPILVTARRLLVALWVFATTIYLFAGVAAWLGLFGD